MPSVNSGRGGTSACRSRHLSPPPLTAEATRFRLFDSVTTFVTAAATTEPLVLILDDLHWADAPSLLLLEFLARDLSACRLLLAGTYRGEEGRQ